MLAFTIQFSKYGQDNQHINHHTLSRNTIKGNNTPIKRTHQQFGESRPQPPDTHRSAKIHASVTQKKQPQTPRNLTAPVSQARFLRTQQRASTIHSTPYAFHASSPKGIRSTNPLGPACSSNGQCSTFRSTVALERMSKKRRIDDHPCGSIAECSLERR